MFDVIDLYNRAKIGTRVIVTWADLQLILQPILASAATVRCTAVLAGSLQSSIIRA